ncbi:MAG: MFS transporter [Myxococcales bacterium]|nr:MFS transporter [Myxococcales bacterium]
MRACRSPREAPQTAPSTSCDPQRCHESVAVAALSLSDVLSSSQPHPSTWLTVAFRQKSHQASFRRELNAPENWGQLVWPQFSIPGSLSDVGLSEKIGLGRPELRAWALYDWANSAFITVIVTAIFPIYYRTVANQSDIKLDPHVAGERLAFTTTIALAIIAVLAPILGAIADTAPVKKKFLAFFMALGVCATLGMLTLGPDRWILASVLFGLGNIGAMGSFVFYDSLLPHIAEHDEVDRVSTAGYALGYISGGIVLLLCIQLVKHPGMLGLADAEVASRVSFAFVAIWWVAFALPLFRKVPEPAIVRTTSRGTVALIRSSFAGLKETFAELRKYKQASIFLLAFLIYNDGVGTIIRFAVIYGEEKQLESSAMITAIVLVQFVGIPATFAFGQVASKLSAKMSIYICLVVYCGVSVLGYFMTTTTHFFLLAGLVGLVQGGVQALSRSLFATLIPKHKSSEFFGLFAVFEKFAGILGPLLFAVVISLTGSSSPAILAISAFFAIGALLLSRVDVAEGQRQARESAAE